MWPEVVTSFAQFISLYNVLTSIHTSTHSTCIHTTPPPHTHSHQLKVKKGLVKLYHKMEKDMSDVSQLEVTWGIMQKAFIEQFKEFEDLIEKCYPGSSITWSSPLKTSPIIFLKPNQHSNDVCLHFHVTVERERFSIPIASDMPFAILWYPILTCGSMCVWGGEVCMNACGMCRCVCSGECITERNELGEGTTSGHTLLACVLL